MEPIITACTLDCPDACSLLVDSDTKGRIRVRGNPDHPFTAGFTCMKIKRYPARLANPDRITRPLLKVGSGWNPISWDEALDFCADKLNTLTKTPDSILHVSGSADMAVLKDAGFLLFGSLGAATAVGSLCSATGTEACIADFGVSDHNDIEDLPQARRIVLWGKDVNRCSVHTAGLVTKAKKAGARILSITAGGDENESLADQVVNLLPGTDRFLATAVLHRMLERGTVSDKVVSRAFGWDNFCRMVISQSQNDLLDICGISMDELEAVFTFYNSHEPVATLIGWGLQRYRFGGQNVRFINALCFAAGHIGVFGGSSYFFLPITRNINSAWVQPVLHRPQKKFQKPIIAQEILAADPPVKFMWINGTNLVNQTPDYLANVRALKHVETVIVVDAFMTDTALNADLILPCALVMEKEDIVTSYLHNYVNYARSAFDPPGQARSDHWIFRELGKRLVPAVDIPSISECLAASLKTEWLETGLDDLRKNNWIKAKRPRVLFENNRFAHPDGRYHPPKRLDPEEKPPATYPLRLLTLIRKEALHSQMLPADHNPLPTIEISKDGPGLAGVDLNKQVWLVSPLARMPVNIKINSALRPELAIGRRGGWARYGHGYNRIIEAGLTDMGEGAAFYQQFVRLEN